ncbi:hypothetical protein PLICRDRAFT_695837 [Plicaturopsis crispa FD-325 SS-3]|nr:hypothetical protein PLICRDRAFT_695837 [Plicaturopsis crispa FD-325 SS-3]
MFSTKSKPPSRRKSALPFSLPRTSLFSKHASAQPTPSPPLPSLPLNQRKGNNRAARVIAPYGSVPNLSLGISNGAPQIPPLVSPLSSNSFCNLAEQNFSDATPEPAPSRYISGPLPYEPSKSLRTRTSFPTTTRPKIPSRAPPPPPVLANPYARPQKTAVVPSWNEEVQHEKTDFKSRRHGFTLETEPDSKARARERRTSFLPSLLDDDATESPQTPAALLSPLTSSSASMSSTFDSSTALQLEFPQPPSTTLTSPDAPGSPLLLFSDAETSAVREFLRRRWGKVTEPTRGLGLETIDSASAVNADNESRYWDTEDGEGDFSWEAEGEASLSPSLYGRGSADGDENRGSEDGDIAADDDVSQVLRALRAEDGETQTLASTDGSHYSDSLCNRATIYEPIDDSRVAPVLRKTCSEAEIRHRRDRGLVGILCNETGERSLDDARKLQASASLVSLPGTGVRPVQAAFMERPDYERAWSALSSSNGAVPGYGTAKARPKTLMPLPMPQLARLEESMAKLKGHGPGSTIARHVAGSQSVDTLARPTAPSRLSFRIDMPTRSGTDTQTRSIRPRISAPTLCPSSVPSRIRALPIQQTPPPSAFPARTDPRMLSAPFLFLDKPVADRAATGRHRRNNTEAMMASPRLTEDGTPLSPRLGHRSAMSYGHRQGTAEHNGMKSFWEEVTPEPEDRPRASRRGNAKRGSVAGRLERGSVGRLVAKVVGWRKSWARKA